MEQQVQMSTADYALIVSLVSVVISLAGFVWNVWSKFIFPQPRLRVRFSVSQLIDLGSPEPLGPRILTLSAVNHGQTATQVTGALVRLRQSDGTVAKAQPWALTNPHWSSEVSFNPGFPKDVGRGERCEISFPFEAESVFRRGVVAIGFLDSLGRESWAPRNNLRGVQDALRLEFPASWTKEALAAARMGP